MGLAPGRYLELTESQLFGYPSVSEAEQNYIGLIDKKYRKLCEPIRFYMRLNHF